jgi:membrane protein involved in colicin uptake
MARPSEVQNELDELRNRGIAKLLNRHLTATTAKLAKEKAEVDAALADLDQRRANTSEFVPSTGGALNPFDSMYVELQQKRAESRRKERETILLYQRYVHKFGNTGNVAVPKVAASLPAKDPSSPSSTYVTAQEAPPPPSPIPLNAPLHSLDEDDDESPRESIKEDDSDETPPTPAEPEATSVPEETKPAPVEPVAPVERETPSLPACVEESTFVSNKEGSDPESVFETSIKLKNEATKLAPAMEVITAQESADASALEQQPSEPTSEEAQAASETSHNSENRPTKEVVAELPPATPVTNYEDDTDDLSVISGLTTVNSATTRKVMEELETELDAFIKTETENIKKMMEMEDTMSMFSVDNNSVGNESQLVAIRAEVMAKQMQKILDGFKDDPSVIAATTIAEEDETTEATTHTTTQGTLNYPHKYETDNPNKEWMVHWDDSYKKEYYHEVRSNQTQWDPPPSSSSSNPRVETDLFSHSDVMPEFNEARSPRRSSRKDIYRKRRRRQRVRRFVALSFVLCCVGLVLLNWKQNYPEKTFQEAAGVMVDDARFLNWETVKNRIEYAVTDRRVREEEETEKARRAAELKRQEEAERKRHQAELKRQAKLKVKEEAERLAAAERKRLEKIAAESKAQKEAHQREVEKKKNLAEEQLKRKLDEDSKLRELERRALEETERKAEAERKSKEEELKSHRPWKCNIPVLSRISGRCRAYSKAHPTYNDTDLARFFVE